MSIVSVFLALIPIIWLLAAFMIFRIQGYKAAAIAVLISVGLAMAFWHMNGAEAASALLEGALTALWPICLVILSALYAYNITEETGSMDTIKKMLTGISSDELVLLLIVGYGFGGFMEGMAGFGTAVAVPAGILVGVGMRPVPVIVACVIGDAAASAYGSVGLGFFTMSAVSGVDEMSIGKAVAVIQFLPSLAAPFLMVLVYGGWKGLRKVFLLTCAAAAVNVGIVTLYGYFIGEEIPYILGSICCMLVVSVLAGHIGPAGKEHDEQEPEAEMLSLKQVSIAWAPFVLAFLLLFLSSSLFPGIHEAVNAVRTDTTIFTGENAAMVSFRWLGAPGVAIFVAAFIGGRIQGAGLSVQLATLKKTFAGNWKTVAMIVCVLAMAKVMGYSGMILVIAECLIMITGSLFPLISPLIGMLGGFITGSASMTTMLFGGLQADTGRVIGIDPGWLTAANMYGAGVGKMISLQTLTIGTAAARISGRESEVMAQTVRYAFLLIAAAGVICWLFPMFLYPLPW